MAYGAILGQNVDNALRGNINYYIDPNTGSDTAGDGSQESPYGTIQYAIDTIPKNLGGYRVTINLAPGTYDESVTISGFSASRSTGIQLIGGSSLDEASQYIISGTILHVGNASSLQLLGVTANMVLIQGGYALVRYLQSTANTSYGITVSYGGLVSVLDCVLSNKTKAGIQVTDASVVSVRNVSGTGNAVGLMAGSSSTASCGIIMKGTGVTITGTTQETIYGGSQITCPIESLNIRTPRPISAGTSDMTAGSTSLATGTIYLMYE